MATGNSVIYFECFCGDDDCAPAFAITEDYQQKRSQHATNNADDTPMKQDFAGALPEKESLTKPATDQQQKTEQKGIFGISGQQTPSASEQALQGN